MHTNDTNTMRIKNRSGQVMLLTVLVMSAVFLSATVIAGLLMVYQLGQVTKVVDSAEAIFAADAATERALFAVFRCNDPIGQIVPFGWGNINTFCNSAANREPLPPPPIPAFLNDASYQLTIEEICDSGNHISGATLSTVKCIKATGRSGKSARAFEVEF